MKAGVYSSSWEYLGGGEKVLGVIAERLVQRGWDVTLMGPAAPDIDSLNNVLQLDLNGCESESVKPALEPLVNLAAKISPRAERVLHGRLAFSFAKKYDLFVYITGEIPPVCPARSGLLFIQFPYKVEESVLVDELGNPIRLADREKLARIRTWKHAVCPSGFVRKWIMKRWRTDAEVLYPPSEISDCKPSAKEKVILTVGRFYATGPIKKHAVMIDAFKRLCDSGLKGWKLKVIGGTHPREDHMRYYQDMVSLAEGYPVEIITNLTFQQMLPHCASASIYWHATGAGEDVETTPELFEQFGMSIVEAMACGAVPVVIGGGGPAEIVRDGIDGFLWLDVSTLCQKTLSLIDNPWELEAFSASAIARAQEFSREAFEKRVDELLLRYRT